MTNRSKTYFEGETYEKINVLEEGFTKGEYENCIFSNCDLSNADLSTVVFIECEFKDCNISMAKIARTAFRDVKFKHCKLLGLQFDSCNDFLFAVEFHNCQINFASFHNLRLKNIKFNNCSLHEVDFGNTDLSYATFDECDLLDASFDRTNLEKSDLRTAYNFIIDPENNIIKGAKFSIHGLAGLLAKYQIEIER